MFFSYLVADLNLLKQIDRHEYFVCENVTVIRETLAIFIYYSICKSVLLWNIGIVKWTNKLFVTRFCIYLSSVIR